MRCPNCKSRHAGRNEALCQLVRDAVPHDMGLRISVQQEQRWSLPGYRSRRLTRIVDPLHCAPSQASRLVQAVDVVAFLFRRIRPCPGSRRCG